MARSGSGTLTEANGATYVGRWVDGLQHGTGEHRSPDGVVYNGEWAAGERSGQGTCDYGNGECYVGEWSGDVRDGRGKLARRVVVEGVDVEVFSYEGTYVNDCQCGSGKSVQAPPPHGNGETYEGGFLRGERHGFGKCVYPNGDCYIGDWRHGEKDGAGSLAHTATEGSYTNA